MTKQSVISSVIVVCAGALLGYVTGIVVVKERLSDAVATAKVDIAQQMTTLATLSEVMARGGVDAVTDSVIKDCPAEERNRFDTLLSGLSASVNQPELVELSRLYDRCAAFYSRRKAVMTARLTREVELYELFTQRLSVLSEAAASEQDFMIKEWKELVELEKNQTATFDKLVTLQGSIIDELLKGRSLVAPEITALLKEVQETQEMQTYNSVQMGQLRTRLSSL